MSTTTEPTTVATTSAITVANPLPATLVALSGELVAKRDALAQRAAGVRICDAGTLALAETLFVEIDAFTKDVHNGRMEITRKLDALKAQIMDAEASAVDVLKQHRQAVGKAITDYRAEVRRIAEEQAKKAREAAEAEAKRLREEAAAKAKAEEERLAAERAKRAEEAALFGDDAPAPAPAPVVPIVPVVPVVSVAPSVPAVPDLPKSAVKTQTRKRLVIDNAPMLLAAACKEGGSLYGRQVLTVDEKAVDALLRAGCIVPGARLEEFETIASNGRGR